MERYAESENIDAPAHFALVEERSIALATQRQQCDEHIHYWRRTRSACQHDIFGCGGEEGEALMG